MPHVYQRIAVTDLLDCGSSNGLVNYASYGREFMLKHGYRNEYLDGVLTPEKLAERVECAVRELRTVDFDSILVMGMSGAIFGGALSVRLQKPLILVRKEEDISHSTFQVQGYVHGAKRFIFLDDQICTGETFEKAFRTFIGERAPNYLPEFVGAYLHDFTRFYDNHDISIKWPEAYQSTVVWLKEKRDAYAKRIATPKPEFIGPSVGELLGYKLGQSAEIDIPAGSTIDVCF